jgi:hypothetical protein
MGTYIVDDIKEVLSTLRSWTIHHILREANFVVHEV